MKTLFCFLLFCGLGAGLLAPIAGRTMWQRAQERGIPKAVARSTAHGLRLAWDWVAGVQPATGKGPARKAAARRVSREGIVAQPPKEKLSPSDKDALDGLIRH
ncbi:MAG: hypothetical protein ABR567_22595 [Myxococcales bacterium]|nr:hypothetical protein [Myxococcales bacterium]